MARTYAPIWDQLKRTDVAEVSAHKDRLATIRQAVIKLKCEENVLRISLGKQGYGKLEILYTELDPRRQLWKISFKLLRNPRHFQSVLTSATQQSQLLGEDDGKDS